jgi:phenylacetate-CoA ligase
MERLNNILRVAASFCLPSAYISRREFSSELANAHASEWDESLLKTRLVSRFQTLLLHAKENVPFYERMWSSIGFNPREIKNEEDLRSLPILDKQDLKRYYAQLFSRDLPPVSLSYTSATRGASTAIIKPRRADRLSVVALRRLFNAIELPPYTVVVNLLPWPSPPQSRRFRYDWSVLWIDVGMANYCDRARTKKPIRSDAIIAPSSVSRKVAGDLALEWQLITKAIINCYERLSELDREFITSCTKLPLFDLYAASEVVAPIAFECAEHTGLHINDDYVIVEVVNDYGEPVEPNQSGQVLVTDLLNLAMPLIRYKVGDIATKGVSYCKCGRSLSILKSIDGRVGDTISRKDGCEIAVTKILDDLSANLGTEFCLIQEDSEVFTLMVETTNCDTVCAEKILERHLGVTIKLNLLYNSNIQTSPSRKPSRFISKLTRSIHIPTDKKPDPNTF